MNDQEPVELVAPHSYAKVGCSNCLLLTPTVFGFTVYLNSIAVLFSCIAFVVFLHTMVRT